MKHLKLTSILLINYISFFAQTPIKEEYDLYNINKINNSIMKNINRYPLKEMEEFLLNFKTVEYKTYGFFGAFGRTEKQRNFLGKINNLINLIIPRRCNYLIVGVATK